MRGVPRVPHRSPPCKFLSSFFCKCILQGAIGFAERRKRSGGANGWAGEYTDGRILSSPIFFSEIFGECNLLDFAELRMRSWRRGAECSAFFGIAGFAPTPNFERTFRCKPRVAHRSPPRKFFCKCILQGAIDFAELPILARQGVAGFAPEL